MEGDVVVLPITPNVPGMEVTRRKTDFSCDSKRRVMRETWEISISNFTRDDLLDLVIVETMFRWSEWGILSRLVLFLFFSIFFPPSFSPSFLSIFSIHLFSLPYSRFLFLLPFSSFSFPTNFFFSLTLSLNAATSPLLVCYCCYYCFFEREQK